MQLSVRELATALKVSERTIYQWIKEGSLRAHRVNGQFRFNRSELLEWATERRRDLPPELLHNTDEEAPPAPPPGTPIVLQVARPTVPVCLLPNPIEFGWIDGQPVHTLFLLISPTVR